MKYSTLALAAALAFVALPDTAAAQSRTSDGWWDWAARSERTTRTDRTTRTERTERQTTDRQGTVRPGTPQRRTTRGTDRRQDARRDQRVERRDRDDNRYEDRDDQGVRARKNGPKFCQNGTGHPTKGMQWCYEKGYTDRRYDRRYDDRRDDRWERRSIEDIIFGTPRDRDRRTQTVNRSVLDDILGRRAYSELQSVASGSVTGRWVYPDGTSRVLQLRDARGPLAEMTDFDGDNRVDLFLIDRNR